MIKQNKRSNLKPNRLINEKSPYLLQHAYNPVDWYPWGPEAFEKAKVKDRPIFLSIGYSTCHWCHVMESESFEDSEVAKLMNDTFISIKVDREERPDIDNIYMSICQAITGSGGWPLTIIMTPEKKPFYAATYLPKEPRFNQPGLKRLAKAIKHMWSEQRADLLNSADQITQSLQSVTTTRSVRELDKDVLVRAFNQLSNRYDAGFGGFSSAPKFPEPHILMFLLRTWYQTGDEQALEMVEHTLDYMRRGGIFDHIGFGFHRYSTDQHWLVPHFEKMLYDQAMLAMAYTEAYQATGKEYYKQTAEEIFTYVLRDMTSDEGGFYSAEDADSEGEEGKFYVWTLNELKKVLNKTELDLAVKIFDVEQNGNYVDSVLRKKTGGNILHFIKSKSKLTDELGSTDKEFNAKLEKIRDKLFKVRKKRVHPHKDDKILMDWNGLMIAALAKGAQVFNNEQYKLAAEKALKFSIINLFTPDGRLYHRYRDGEPAVKGFLNDYSFIVWALIELYETTFEKKYLDYAIELNSKMLEHFWDFQDGGLFFTADDNEELLMRNKETLDGAIPSGNAVAFYNLLRLSRLAKDHTLEEKAAELGKAISDSIRRIPIAHTQFLIGLGFALGPSFEVLIEGDMENKDTEEMLRALRTNFIPNKVVHCNMKMSSLDMKKDDELFTLPDPSKLKENTNKSKTMAYVCMNYSCQKPTSDIKEMLSQLGVKNSIQN
jgi:uncharacterized protein YyaL (SSP411 family)